MRCRIDCSRREPRPAAVKITDVEPIVLRLDQVDTTPRRRNAGRLPRPGPHRRGDRRRRRGRHVAVPRADDRRDAVVALDRARAARGARRRGSAADRPALAADVPRERPLRPRRRGAARDQRDRHRALGHRRQGRRPAGERAARRPAPRGRSRLRERGDARDRRRGAPDRRARRRGAATARSSSAGARSAATSPSTRSSSARPARRSARTGR